MSPSSAMHYLHEWRFHQIDNLGERIWITQSPVSRVLECLQEHLSQIWISLTSYCVSPMNGKKIERDAWRGKYLPINLNELWKALHCSFVLSRTTSKNSFVLMKLVGTSAYGQWSTTSPHFMFYTLGIVKCCQLQTLCIVNWNLHCRANCQVYMQIGYLSPYLKSREFNSDLDNLLKTLGI